MEHQTLGRRFICPIDPATKLEFILDWRISTQIVCPSPKVWDFDEKRASLGVRSPWIGSKMHLHLLPDLAYHVFFNISRIAWSIFYNILVEYVRATFRFFINRYQIGILFTWYHPSSVLQSSVWPKFYNMHFKTQLKVS